MANLKPISLKRTRDGWKAQERGENGQFKQIDSPSNSNKMPDDYSIVYDYELVDAILGKENIVPKEIDQAAVNEIINAFSRESRREYGGVDDMLKSLESTPLENW